MIAVNTRILKAEFDYFAPASIGEALALIAQNGPTARFIAGGTDLLVQMKLETVAPGCLISLMKISELSVLKREKGFLRIGAAVTWDRILAFGSEDRSYPALDDAVRCLGKVQVRRMGTIGGNLCTASPAADSAPALLVYDSRVRLVSARGRRTLLLDKYFLGVQQTARAADEIMTEIRIPAPRPDVGGAFQKLARVGADISKISCAVAVERKGRVCVSCRVAMGAVAPVPLMIRGVPEFLQEKTVTASLLVTAGRMISDEIRPITDVRSTAEYRKQVAGVLFRDVFQKAWTRAGGEP